MVNADGKYIPAKVGTPKAAVPALAEMLANHSSRRHTPVDLKNLPWRNHEAKRRDAATNVADLNKRLGLTGEKALPAHPGAAKLAPPTDADLAPALEAPHSDLIKAKAAELGKDPLKIYQWVRNNIHFFPSHGSVQGAEDTLNKLRGNAVDTSSLLLALLRVSGIHARYAYGTIELPVDKVTNWIGTENAEAASQIMAQGGIPHTLITRGGKVSAFQLEHMWVEAWIDYFPSRGAKHRKGNAWVPMEVSYKPFNRTAGINLASALPIDAKTILMAAIEGSTSNVQEGWVQNLDQTAIRSRLADYQTALRDHIDARIPGAKLDDIFGRNEIVKELIPILNTKLPYNIIQLISPVRELSERFRHQFRYAVHGSESEAHAVWQLKIPTAKLAGKQVVISFVPASSNDLAAVLALLPKPETDGARIDLRELPTRLPSSIRVKAELRIEGELVYSGGAFPIGTELSGVGAFTTYANQDVWDESADNLVAGQTSVIGISIQGISRNQVLVMEQRLKSTKAALERYSNSINLGDDVVGGVLTSTIWGYFANLHGHQQFLQSVTNVSSYPGLSFGLMHLMAQSRMLFGGVGWR